MEEKRIMKGIRLSHGAVFVTDGEFTVRLLPTGECGPSPVLYGSLEWELRTEPPHLWDYVSDTEIQNLPDGGGEKIRAAFAKMREVTEMREELALAFTCAEDFFRKASALKKLSRASEKAYAAKMAQGDESAHRELFLSYLPTVAAFVKKKSRDDRRLELIYRLLASLEKAVDGFDFQQDSEAFSHRLLLAMNKTMTEYIADK